MLLQFMNYEKSFLSHCFVVLFGTLDAARLPVIGQ
jgi:hypothetical protein